MAIRHLSWAPASPERYRYQPLPKSHSIRLLQVGKYDSEHPRLRCWLYTCPLADGLRPPFDALSYCWNAPVIDEDDEDGTRGDYFYEIEVNGTSWMITESLYEALLARSRSGEERLLWADALCINQTHDEEKTEQVALMGEIYSAADRVIIWLGQNETYVDDMVYIHTKVSSALDRLIDTHGAAFAFQISPLDPAVFNMLGLDISLDEWFSIWRSYFRFFRTRRWFFRAWIVQEVVLAREVQVRCGDKLIPWEPLLALGRFIMYSGWTQLLAPVEQKLKLAGISELNSIWSMQLEYRSGGPWSPAFRESQQQLSGARTDSEFWYWYLLWALDNIRGQQATDPRDKIYSVLGMTSKFLPARVKPPIRPSYSELSDPSEVFISTARLLLDRLPNLAFLSLAEDQVDRKILDLPSWVPDWSGPGSNYGHLSWEQLASTPLFDASRVNTLYEPPCKVVDRTLFLRAAHFDTITAVSEPIGLMVSTHWIQPCLRICEMLPETYAPTSQHRVEVLWRTLIADEFEGQHPAPAEAALSFRDWASIVLALGLYLRWTEDRDTKHYLNELSALESLTSSELLPTEDQVLEKAELLRSGLDDYPNKDDSEVLRFLKDGDGNAVPFGGRLGATGGARRLYVTAGGYLGIGPGSIKEGDAVWLVQGGRVPFVFRMAQSTAGMRLLGETYVHGFMHGEMVDAVGTTMTEVKVV